MTVEQQKHHDATNGDVSGNPFGEVPIRADSLKNAAAQDLNLTVVQAIKLYPKSILWSLIMSTALIMEGYDTVLLGSLFAQPAFQKRYGEPAGHGRYEIPAPWQSGLAASSNIGMLSGLITSGYLCERFGFKKTMIGGMVLIICLIFITFFAPGVEVLLVGQLLFGVALGMFQTLPAVYAMEVSPTSLRAILTNYINCCWVFGAIIGTGVLRGVLHRTDEWAYRIPFACQWLWPVVLIPFIAFAPESPWWLVRQGRLDDANAVLQRLTSPQNVSYDIDKAITLMVATTTHERAVDAATSYTACFDRVNLRRTLVTIGVYAVQPLSGLYIRAYSAYFLIQAGLSPDTAFTMTLVTYGVCILGNISSWFLLSFFGRRTLYLWGFIAQVVLLSVVGGLGVPHSTEAYGWAICGVLILSSYVDNLSIGPLPNTICSEMPSALLRSKSVVLARFSFAIVTIFGGAITPYQLNPTAWNWSAKTAFFWAGLSVFASLFVYFCLPETKGRTTVELDILFEKGISARKFRGTNVDLAEAVHSPPDEKSFV